MRPLRSIAPLALTGTLLAGLASGPAVAQTAAAAAPALVPPVQATRDPQASPDGLAGKGGYAEPAPPAAALAPEAADTLRRLNALRAAGATCGTERFDPAPPLAWNPLLEQAAVLHARDMAQRGDMSHRGGDGSSMSQRVGRVGYAWSTLGENVSAGYRSVSEGLAGWMASPGHCRNIMGPQFREVGVGAAHAAGDRFGWYRAMVLGSPAR